MVVLAKRALVVGALVSRQRSQRSRVRRQSGLASVVPGRHVVQREQRLEDVRATSAIVRLHRDVGLKEAYALVEVDTRAGGCRLQLREHRVTAARNDEAPPARPRQQQDACASVEVRRSCRTITRLLPIRHVISPSVCGAGAEQVESVESGLAAREE